MRPGTTAADHGPVVLFAASAGGIQALSMITRALPRDFPAAVVVVQHRAPDRHKSMFRQLLARVSPLPVEDATDGQTIHAGTIYVARPDLHLTIDRDRRFHYTDGRRIRHLLSSANPLFSSSAAAFGPEAIAVVLTGSGMDATDGVQAIKAHGGIVIAQDPSTSAHFGMPTSAIRTGAVDYVLPLEQIVPTLVRLLSHNRELTT